jgi:hypothetical protein
VEGIGNNPAALAGIIVGGVVFVAIIIGVVIYMRKRRQASGVVYGAMQ